MNLIERTRLQFRQDDEGSNIIRTKYLIANSALLVTNVHGQSNVHLVHI